MLSNLNGIFLNKTINFHLTLKCSLGAMCGLCVCVCVSLPTYQATEGCRFHKFIPLSIKHSTLASQPFFCCLCTSDPITLPFPLLLSVGFWATKLLSLSPMTLQVTSSPSLTFRVRAALGKGRWTDLPIQGTAELQRGRQGLALLHYPTN